MKTIFKTVFLIISLNFSAQTIENQISVDREDGFYSVIDYSSRKSELKDLKLSLKAEISIREVLEIKKLKDDIDNDVIDIVFTDVGRKKFKVLTQNNIGKPIAIVLNKKLVSAPVVLDEIPNGQVRISGKFNENDIDEMIRAVKKSNH